MEHIRGMQDDVRADLMEYIKINPISISALSKEMKINHLTLTRFLKEGRNISFKTMMTIMQYLEDV